MVWTPKFEGLKLWKPKLEALEVTAHGFFAIDSRGRRYKLGFQHGELALDGFRRGGMRPNARDKLLFKMKDIADILLGRPRSVPFASLQPRRPNARDATEQEALHMLRGVTNPLDRLEF